MIGIRSAFSIRARGQWPHLEAVYMTAPRSLAEAPRKSLPRGGRPYMTNQIRTGWAKARNTVPTLLAPARLGGHASLCPPYNSCSVLVALELEDLRALAAGQQARVGIELQL